jgi:DNA-binding cell septation regulator SpoVG
MSNNLDVRVYLIDEPKGNTLAFASVAVDDLAVIRGVRVVNDKDGLFVSMPQSQDNKGLYHDIAFLLEKERQQEISNAVLDEFAYQANLAPDERGYENQEQAAISRSAEEVKLDIKVFPLSGSRGDTLAFASAALDDTVVIRGIRVVNSDDGKFVSMPQSKDKHGKFHDVARPLSGDVRKLYAAAIRAAKAMGYRRILTYTLPSECGASLKAVGFTLDGQTAYNHPWNTPARPRRTPDKYPAGSKNRWIKNL